MHSSPPSHRANTYNIPCPVSMFATICSLDRKSRGGQKMSDGMAGGVWLHIYIRIYIYIYMRKYMCVMYVYTYYICIVF